MRNLSVSFKKRRNRTLIHSKIAREDLLKFLNGPGPDDPLGYATWQGLRGMVDAVTSKAPRLFRAMMLHDPAFSRIRLEPVCEDDGFSFRPELTKGVVHPGGIVEPDPETLDKIRTKEQFFQDYVLSFINLVNDVGFRQIYCCARCKTIGVGRPDRKYCNSNCRSAGNYEKDPERKKAQVKDWRARNPGAF